MTTYRQLTSGERYALSALKRQGCSPSQIARALGRISTFAARRSSDANGMDPTTAVADWRANGRSLSDRRVPRTEVASGTSRATRSWAPRTSTAY